MIEPPKRFQSAAPGCCTLAIGATVISAVLLSLSGGCFDPSGQGTSASGQVPVLRQRIGQLERDLVTLAEENNTLNHQVDELLRLGTNRLELLNAPVRIEIERMSGGYDDDNVVGDDGVVVYVRPFDSVGDVIKATGDIEIQLWDLSGTPDEVLVGQYVLDAEHALGHWYGKLMTDHYTIKCPWRSEPPRHTEITIRVLFTDYVTGKVLTDQRVCGIFLPPGSAGQP